MVTLLFPPNGFLFDTHTDIQKEFIKRVKEEGIDTALLWFEPIKQWQERTLPAPLVFEWESDETQFVFELSKTEDFAHPITIKTNKKTLSFNNFEIGQTYYWRVNGGKPCCFETKDSAYRFVEIDGVLNVRDLGGISMKQGLLYRGGELNEITAAGIHTFVDILGIKTELDLRAEQIGKLNGSPAGDAVVLKQLGYRPYLEIFEEQHKLGICKIMQFLADETNYPIFFHCVGGADRTGMIAIYLRALMGESDDDIHLDYEFTGLSTYAQGITEGATGFRRRTSDYYVSFLNALDAYAPGQPLSVQVKAFLSDCGVKEEHIQKIISILKK